MRGDIAMIRVGGGFSDIRDSKITFQRIRDNAREI